MRSKLVSKSTVGCYHYFIFRFRVNLQQQFRAKISKISELEKHSHEILTEETEKEDPMLPNILRDTESYHLVIGKAFEIFVSKMSVLDNLLLI